MKIEPAVQTPAKTSDKYAAKKCRYCNETLNKPFLNLGKQPLANNLVPPEKIKDEEFKCDLALTLCSKCKLTQLSHVVPPDLMFKHYLYVSSTTKTFREHFSNYAKDLKDRIKNKVNPVAVDIGSNDGLLVQCYLNEGMEAVGVDPAENLAEAANENGIPTFNSYFNERCVELIKKEYGKADVISGNNVFAHIADIQSVMKNVRDLLSEDGIFVVEFPYYATMQEDLVFDMIYHEHLSYINIEPLEYLANCYGLAIVDIKEVGTHGGSLRVYMSWQNGKYNATDQSKKFIEYEKAHGYNNIDSAKKFAANVAKVKQDLWEFVNEAKKQGKKIAGYGAPAKASTIINYCNFGPEDIEFIIDDNPLKQGLLIPGAHIPIYSSDMLKERAPDLLIIFAWNFANEIISKNEHLRETGTTFLTPLPKVRAL